MTFKDEFEAIEAIKKHQTLTPEWKSMREYSKELKSLVNGTDFLDELICKIEGIESANKAKARSKYSKNIKSMFIRLFQPIDNIYYASGGLKDYDIKESIKKEFFQQPQEEDYSSPKDSFIEKRRRRQPIPIWMRDQHKCS